MRKMEHTAAEREHVGARGWWPTAESRGGVCQLHGGDDPLGGRAEAECRAAGRANGCPKRSGWWQTAGDRAATRIDVRDEPALGGEQRAGPARIQILVDEIVETLEVGEAQDRLTPLGAEERRVEDAREEEMLLTRGGERFGVRDRVGRALGPAAQAGGPAPRQQILFRAQQLASVDAVALGLHRRHLDRKFDGVPGCRLLRRSAWSCSSRRNSSR